MTTTTIQFTALDQQMMQRAIELAALGCYTTSPNPNVGSVITKDGQVIGEGYHQQAGGPHAEVFALRQAGEAAKGATAYVTLEPCSHFGRTPPCANALIAAGVSRVVVAMLDPNPLVAGRGVAMLRDAGIRVEVSLLESQARALNSGFLSKMERKRPFCRLKIATSLDGRIALANGESKWLTGALAREDVQLQRAKACAIISSAETVLADDARLDVRSSGITTMTDGQLRQPLRVILDRRARLTGHEALFQTGGRVVLIYSAKIANLPIIQGHQVEVEQWQVDENVEGLLSIDSIMQRLSTMPINVIWLEAGAKLSSAWLAFGVVDELMVYQAPMLLGQDGKAMLSMPTLISLADARRFHWKEVTQLGDDLRLIANLSGY
jgi:diaminohydroxyphosphoribosylaminopyrimidine deaminase/5-amino-6-(5-phosphoribosylamino)uracil reductase